VLTLIRQSKDQRIIHHTLLKYSHLSARELEPIVNHLADQGLIFINRRKKSSRPGKIGTEYIAS